MNCSTIQVSQYSGLICFSVRACFSNALKSLGNLLKYLNAEGKVPNIHSANRKYGLLRAVPEARTICCSAGFCLYRFT